MPPEGGDLTIAYKASEVLTLGNRRYDDGYAAALREVEEAVGNAFAHEDYEGVGHAAYCNRIVFPGSTGPDPEPPDSCSCGGPAVLAAIASLRGEK